MKRIQNQRQAETIERGLALFPPELRRLVEGVDVFFGDPLSAGLHRHFGTYPRADGSGTWNYRQALHFTAPHNQEHRPRSVRVPTVVVPPLWPRAVEPWDVAHEFGHAIDWLFGYPSRRLAVSAVTTYGETNRSESFAEGLSAWLVPHRVWARDSWRAWVRHWAPQLPAFLDAVASPERGFRGL